MTVMKIPFMNLKRQYLEIEKEIQEALLRVFERSSFILGPEGKKFEEQFAQYIGVPYGIGVNSGTDALYLALLALGIGQGDEVLTVANTAIPTVSAIIASGAKPVFVDIEKNTYLMDTTQIERKITPQTKAILPVHLYGNCVALDHVLETAKKHCLFVIEDCAQAHGASFKGRKAGSFGDISCFSFYPTKNLGAYGDAGIILTKNPDIARKLLLLRQYGEEKRYFTVINGFNSRLDELQAAVLLVKQQYLENWNKKRKDIAQKYISGINNKKITLPIIKEDVYPVFHLFVIQTSDRAHFQEYMKNKGISTAIHYPLPLHLQKAYSSLGYAKGSLPVTEEVMEHIVSIPLFPELTSFEIDYIITVINEY